MSDIIASPWIPAAVLLSLAFAARTISRSWFAPSAFVLGFWSIYVTVPLIIVPEYRVSARSVWIITALVMSTWLGAVLGESGSITRPKGAVSPVTTKRILYASLAFTAIGLTGAGYFAVISLRDNGMDFSLMAIVFLGGIIHNTYSDSDIAPQIPFLVRVLSTWVFSGALLAGMSYALSKTRRHRFLCFAPLIPALLFSLLNATRANTLMAVTLGICGFLSMRLACPLSANPRRKLRKLLTAAVIVGIAISFFFAVDFVRGSKENAQLTVPMDWSRMRAASFGYLADFSHWTDHPNDFSANQLTLGGYTFGGVFDMLGLKARAVGVIQEFVNLPDQQTNNIYTAFRSIIQDFTFMGAATLLFCFGLASGCAYRKSISGNLIWIPALATAYAFWVWSPLGSLFVYNGSLLALAVGTVVAWRETRSTRLSSDHKATARTATPGASSVFLS